MHSQPAISNSGFHLHSIDRRFPACRASKNALAAGSFEGQPKTWLRAPADLPWSRIEVESGVSRSHIRLSGARNPVRS